ncbi:DUF305 domain-containing protein [Gordonia sp. VNK1]|uniref:DUF305 domain-containing protein n=1 Tax=Gordonia oleivorans TaxID=3156618 RepID=UPI0032B46419
MILPRPRPSAVVVVIALLVATIVGYTLRLWVEHPPIASAAPLTSVETAFLQDMIGHHQQAVVMGKSVDRDGIDPGVRALARQISESQRYELGTMIGWLRLTGAPMQNPTPMTWMHAGHDTTMPGMAMPHTAMPGMATTEQLDRLAAASGQAAEDLFLTLMYRHHQGGIAMAQTVDPMVSHGAVRQTVRDMISTQSSEVGLIGVMLEQRSATRPVG